MELDYSAPFTALGVIVFPDWAFTPDPKPPELMKDTVVLHGSSTAGTVTITGTGI